MSERLFTTHRTVPETMLPPVIVDEGLAAVVDHVAVDRRQLGAWLMAKGVYEVPLISLAASDAASERVRSQRPDDTPLIELIVPGVITMAREGLYQSDDPEVVSAIASQQLAYTFQQHIDTMMGTNGAPARPRRQVDAAPSLPAKQPDALNVLAVRANRAAYGFGGTLLGTVVVERVTKGAGDNIAAAAALMTAVGGSMWTVRRIMRPVVSRVRADASDPPPAIAAPTRTSRRAMEAERAQWRVSSALAAAADPRIWSGLVTIVPSGRYNGEA